MNTYAQTLTIWVNNVSVWNEIMYGLYIHLFLPWILV